MAAKKVARSTGVARLHRLIIRCDAQHLHTEHPLVRGKDVASVSCTLTVRGVHTQLRKMDGGGMRGRGGYSRGMTRGDFSRGRGAPTRGRGGPPG